MSKLVLNILKLFFLEIENGGFVCFKIFRIKNLKKTTSRGFFVLFCDENKPAAQAAGADPS